MSNNIEELFQDMFEKGLISTSSTWIERAVSQKNPNLKISLAHSKLLIYDKVEKLLMQLENLN